MQPHPKADRSLAPLACVICGAMFAPYRASQQTCSQPCNRQLPHKQAAARARQARPDAKERKNAARRIDANPSRRAVNLRYNLRQYGVTPEWYEAKLAEQGNRCAICGRTPPPGGRKSASRLHVDHCHDTSQVRDLLCNRCNPGLGHFHNDPALLEAAAAYLRRHQTQEEPMIVTMRRQLSGTRDGVDWPAPGETIDVPDDEGASLIELKLAQAADEAPADEAPAARKGARQATNEPA